MGTATITIPDDLRDALEAYRRQHRLAADDAEIIRDVARRYLEQHGYVPRRPARPLRITPADQGSGFSDVSVNHDYYLAEGLLERKMGRSG